MAITAAITLAHPQALSGDPQTSITLSSIINQATGTPVSSVGVGAPASFPFNVTVTITNSAATPVNVTGVTLYASPHELSQITNGPGGFCNAAPVTFGYANIGPTQVFTVPASGSLKLQPIPSMALAPIDTAGENYDIAGVTNWSASLVVAAAGLYIVNGGPGGLVGGGGKFVSLNAGTTASSGNGPQVNKFAGSGKPILDGTVYWLHAHQQVFDICAEIRTSDGAITQVNPTAGGNGILTVQASRPE